MDAIDFPNSPSNGQTYIVGTTVWTYDSPTNGWSISGQTLPGATGSNGPIGAVGVKGISLIFNAVFDFRSTAGYAIDPTDGIYLVSTGN